MSDPVLFPSALGLPESPVGLTANTHDYGESLTNVDSDVKCITDVSIGQVPHTGVAKAISFSGKHAGGTPHVLIIFSGRPRPDSLKHFLQLRGLEVTTFEVLESASQDLTDDFVWMPLRVLVVNGKFSALIAMPPCGTFSRVRSMPGGPPLLRGPSGRERYGLPNLSASQKEWVREHNLLAVRAADLATLLIAQGLPVVLEQPALREGEVSMLNLDEFIAMRELPAVMHVIAPQCPSGANAAKLTSWATHLVSFSDMPTECKHLPRKWFAAGTGLETVGKHAPSTGTALYFSDITAALQQELTHPGFVTSSLSDYPPLLNQYIAAKVALAVGCSQPYKKLRTEVTQVKPDCWNKRLGKERVEFSTNLRGSPAADTKAQEENQAVGGLRDVAKTASALSFGKVLGKAIGLDIRRIIVQNLLDNARAGTPGNA
jgi:hypothetical protein